MNKAVCRPLPLLISLLLVMSTSLLVIVNTLNHKPMIWLDIVNFNHNINKLNTSTVKCLGFIHFMFLETVVFLKGGERCINYGTDHVFRRFV